MFLNLIFTAFIIMIARTTWLLWQEKKWRITKINDDLEMTRIEGQMIACRKLNWFEKIIYWKGGKRMGKHFNGRFYW